MPLQGHMPLQNWNRVKLESMQSQQIKIVCSRKESNHNKYDTHTHMPLLRLEPLTSY